MTINIQVVPASEIDLADHTRFQRAAFAKRFSLLPASTVQSEAYYAWKYRTPAGIARVARAFAGDNLVGLASAVPVRFAGHPDGTGVWQVCDLATDRNFRGRGILTGCATRLRAEIGMDALMYVLPNAGSRGPLLRAGFAETGRIHLYVTPRPLLARHARSAALRAWADRAGGREFAGQGLDLLDPATLDWRFRARPGVSYRVLAVPSSGAARSIAVIRGAGGRLPLGVLMALRLTQGEDVCALTELLVRSMASHGEAALVTLCEDPPPWHRHSVRVPEVFAPRRFPVLTLNLGPRATSFTAAEWDVL